MTPPTDPFLTESSRYLGEVYLPRLARALATLPEDDLFWQPHRSAISFGTILRHLEGNVRQWILSGIGGLADERERAREFTGEASQTGAQLFGALRGTIQEARTVIEALTPAALDRCLTIQGFEISAQNAIYHVVEHFSWHTGQAVWIAKARAGEEHGLAFYDDAKINVAHNR